MQAKNTRNKFKTLCTIDTSDIELPEKKLFLETRNPNRPLTSKNKTVDSPCFRKTSQHKRSTPSRHGISATLNCQAVRARNSVSKSKSKNKNSYNLTCEKSRQRVKTDYSTTHSETIIKSLLTKNTQHVKDKPSYTSSETYQFDVFEIVKELGSCRPEKVHLVNRMDKLYIMKKTKDPAIRKQYESEAALKSMAIQLKWRNLVKQVKIYTQKSWTYAIYEYSGQCLSWTKVTVPVTQPSHGHIISRILKSSGAILKHIIKQCCKGILELSARGYCHARIRLENICMRIQELSTTIKVEGSVRLTNLSHCFAIRDKGRLLGMPGTIYTPPEVINLQLQFFETGNKFDRELIESIGTYDEPWYVDVWALGVLVLELIAGEVISIEKPEQETKQSRSQSASEVSFDVGTASVKCEGKTPRQAASSEITLSDILQAQKSLLAQAEPQLRKISFDPKLRTLVMRMLSVRPCSRPSPKQIIQLI